jgi:predicted GNAT family N-acyltransferase
VKIIPITAEQAKELVSKYHYLGSKSFRCECSYGAVIDNKVVGACVFHGVSVPETVVGAFGLARNEQEGIYELGRLVLNPRYNGQNHASEFVCASIRLFRKARKVRALISYAEAPRHKGTVYRASNFKYCGLSSPKKDFFVNGKIQERGKTRGIDGIWKDRPRKHRYILVFDKNLKLLWNVEWENKMAEARK